MKRSLVAVANSSTALVSFLLLDPTAVGAFAPFSVVPDRASTCSLSMTSTVSSNAQDSLFLEDGKGHINPELATRIYKWEQQQRRNLNLPEFQHSTRQGLRWVGEIIQELEDQRPSGSGSSSMTKQEDLIQEGVIALMQAMTHFEKEARPQESFETFAKQQIRNVLEKYVLGGRSAPTRNSLSMESTVEIADPLETHYSNQEEWEVREGLVLDNGQNLDPEELVEDFFDEALQYEGEDQMWVHQQQVAAPLRDSIPDASTTDVSSAFDLDDPSAPMSPDDMALTDMIRYNVDEFLGSTLEDLESQIIQMRFGLEEGDAIPKTQKEVAFELDLTVSKVRKLQKSALEKLRNAYTNRYVEDADDDHYWEDTV